MRSLTIKQPWADAITHGTKRVENRSWTTRYRGPVLIHAGATYDPMGRFIITDREALAAWPDTRRAVIATAELVDIHAASAGGCCAPWSEPNAYHWALTQVRTLSEPVPATGRLRLWTPTTDLLRAVHNQLEPDQ
ncbi:ASCH domain-containing protein [Streptomyces sp. NBC_01506]|uniref:ASCH domain-containing protein n=1 Tax=Streptomyces sp. NBC_01506 TaxID=2903887 RepID=UPI00386BEF3B